MSEDATLRIINYPGGDKALVVGDITVVPHKPCNQFTDDDFVLAARLCCASAVREVLERGKPLVIGEYSLMHAKIDGKLCEIAAVPVQKIQDWFDAELKELEDK